MRVVSLLLLSLSLACGSSAATTEPAPTTSTGGEASRVAPTEPVHGELGGVPVDGFTATLNHYSASEASLELTSGMALLRMTLPGATSGTDTELDLNAATAIYTDTTGANLTNDTRIHATVHFGEVAGCASYGADWVTAGTMTGDIDVQLVDAAGNTSHVAGTFSGEVRCAPAE